MPLKVFGKAKKAPSIQESVQKLSETLLLLEKREDYLQKKVQTELQTAKANATTNKKGTIIIFILFIYSNSHFQRSCFNGIKTKKAISISN